MKCKLWVSIILLCFILSGCQRNGNGSDTVAETDISVPGIQSPAAASKSGAGDNDEDGAVREITYMYPWYGTIPRGIPDVEAAINEITVSKINTRVTLKPVSASTFSQQLSLSVTSQETIDLVTVPNDFMQMLSRNQCMDMTELIQTRGQGILDAVGEFINGTKRNGRIYGVTVMGGKATSPHLLMRTDLLEETGVDIHQIIPVSDFGEMGHNLEVVEQIFDRVRAAHPEVEILINSFGESRLESLIGYDSMGDELGVLMDGESYNVENLYASEEFRQVVALAVRWREKGYMMKDAAMNTAASGSIHLAGNSFCDLVRTQQGVEAQYKQTTGYDFTAVQLRTPLLYTGQDVLTVNVLPVLCREPEAAMDFLDLMYTDRDIVNLLAYGVEGIHYRFLPNGTVDYPEGVNAQNSDYPCSQTWLFGNGLLDYVKVGNVPELYEIQARNNETARRSCAFGFMYDNTPVQTQVAACLKVVAEYKEGLLTGALDMSKLKEFNDKLTAAGIDDILEEKQRQLEEWR